MGKADLAHFTTDNSPVADPVFPFDLWFVPNPDLSAQWGVMREIGPDGNEVPFYEQLKTIPKDTVLVHVMARDVPDDLRNFGPSRVQQIANIRATSELVTSHFGDTRLFFQHTSLNNDFAVQPGFRNYFERLPRDDPFDLPIPEWPQDQETAEAWVRGSVAEYGCPFAWLLNNTISPIFSQN